MKLLSSNMKLSVVNRVNHKYLQLMYLYFGPTEDGTLLQRLPVRKVSRSLHFKQESAKWHLTAHSINIVYFITQISHYTCMQLQTKANEDSSFYNTELETMYIFPAKNEYALLHRNATRFSYKNLENNLSSTLRCPCCGNFIFNQEFSLLQSTEPDPPEIDQPTFLLPPGVSMYFKFIKVVIYFLLLRFLIIDLYTIFIGAGGAYCSQLQRQGSTDLCIFTASFANLKTNEDQRKLVMLDYLSCAYTVVSIVFFLYFRTNMKKYYSWLDNCSEVSQENYSIFLENIPMPEEMSEDGQVLSQDKFYKKLIKDEIMKKINEWFNKISKIIKKAELQYRRGQKIEVDPKENVSIIESQLFSLIVNKGQTIKGEKMEDLIERITLCYDLNIYENVNKLRATMTEKYIQEMNEWSKESEQQWVDKEKIKRKIHKLNQSIVKMTLENPKNNEMQFLGKAFVTFRYQPFRSFFLNEYRNNPSFLRISGNNIKISSANRPEEVYWHNLKVAQEERSENLVHSYTILFLLLFVSLVLLLLMQLWQISQTTLDYTAESTSLRSKFKSLLVSLSMSLTTYIINFVLGYSIERLANMERHKATTYRTGSLIIKMVVSQTINTLAIYYILNLMRPFNLLGNFGLATRIINLIFFTSVAQIFLQVIPFNKLKKALLDALLCRKHIDLFQIELNKLYQRPQFNFTEKYAFYIVFTYVVSFYGLLVPTANILLILAFTVLYWVDKYNLFRRSSIIVEIDFFTIKASFAFLEFSLLIYMVGYILWDLMVHFDSQNWLKGLNIVNLFVVTLYLALSYRFDYAGQADWSEQYCVNKNSFSQYVTLMDKRMYEAINPVTAYRNDKKDYNSQPFVRIEREFKRWQAMHQGYFGHFPEEQEKFSEDKIKRWKAWLQENSNTEGTSNYKEDDVVLFQECFEIKKIQLQNYLENMFKQGAT